MSRLHRRARDRRPGRALLLCLLPVLLWTLGVHKGPPGGSALGLQSAAALDLDEPGGDHDAASAPLPAPKDHFPPVHRKPDFLSDDEWAGVQASARAASDPAHETARLVDYLHFQKTYVQWSADRTAQPAQARQLAHALIRDLPDKVAQGVIGAEQAEQTLEQLVEYLEPDPARQERLLAQERRRLPPQPSAPPAFAH